MKKKPFLESLGLFLHPKFEFHLLIELVMNLLIIISIIGLFSLVNYPLVSYDSFVGVIIYIVVFTLIAESLKVYVLRHFINYIFKSKGMILIGINTLLFYLTTFLITDLKFLNPVLLKLIIFSVTHAIFKLIFIIMYQRILEKYKGDENEKMD